MYDRQFDGWGRNLTTGSETFKSQNLGIRSKLLFTPGDRTAIRLTGDYMRVRNCGVCGQVVQIGRATSELQSLMRISYAVFCLTKKKNRSQRDNQHHTNIEHKDK